MKTAYILAGHHRGDPGACAQGYTERDLAMELRDLVARAFVALPGAARYRVMTDNDQATLPEVVAWVKGSCKPGDALLDLHFNAAGPTAQGSEVLVADGAGPKQVALAAAVLTAFTTYGLRSRGVKSEKDSPRKRLGILHAGPDSVLAEACFITSQKDLDTYQRAKQEIAADIAAALLAHLQG